MSLLNQGVAWTFLSFLYFYNSVHNHGSVDVTIDKGVLRGSVVSTWSGTRYLSFKGIPYAKPPIGELRFKGPQEEDSWSGVRDATKHGSVCPHVDITYVVFRGIEDCLFVNVYTPSITAERLPVMFYIHGGKFDISSGNDELWAPDYFVEAGVILVTINYRLGALGYLTTGDDDAPGNAGSKDQVAALRWVRRNIAKFGGDPGRVTLIGASTGAASVQYLYLSPMARGLFVGGIAHSGSAVNDWALIDNGVSFTVRLAVALGAKNVNRNKTKALEFLKTASPENIAWTQEDIFTPAEKRLGREFGFGPTVEKGIKSEEVFISDTPQNILRSGNFMKVPFMTGYTSDEGLLNLNELSKPETMKAATEDTEKYVPWGIKGKRIRYEVAQSVRKFYFNDEPVTNGNISNFINLYGDVAFVNGVKRGAKLQLQSSSSPIYFYVFSYDGDLNLIKFTLGMRGRPGAVHGDELGYLFFHKLLFWRKPAIRSEDEFMLSTMIRLWTNFARYGNPTPAGDPLTWKPATLEQFNYLNISGYNTRPGVNPDPERTNFWEQVYQRYEALRN